MSNLFTQLSPSLEERRRGEGELQDGCRGDSELACSLPSSFNQLSFLPLPTLELLLIRVRLEWYTAYGNRLRTALRASSRYVAFVLPLPLPPLPRLLLLFPEARADLSFPLIRFRYTSDIGESFRPVVPPWVVTAGVSSHLNHTTETREGGTKGGEGENELELTFAGRFGLRTVRSFVGLFDWRCFVSLLSYTLCTLQSS